MSYLARLKQREIAKTQINCPATKPPELTEPGYVGFVSTDAAPLNSHFSESAANIEDTGAAQELPLLVVLDEYDALIGRLRWPESERGKLRALRRRMSPDGIRDSLPKLRVVVASQEREREPDDRITCRECANRRTYDGVCDVADAGGVVNATRGHVPDATLPHRCAGFKSKPGEADQRAGADRWPGLTGEDATGDGIN